MRELHKAVRDLWPRVDSLAESVLSFFFILQDAEFITPAIFTRIIARIPSDFQAKFGGDLKYQHCKCKV